LNFIGQKRQASDFDSNQNSNNQQFQKKRMRTDNYNGNNNRNNYNNTTGFNNRAGKVDLRILLPSKVKYFLKFII
jgi:hypothetical protein